MSNGLSNVRVSYNKGITVNTGDFNNVKPEITVSADVEEGTHPTVAKNKLKAIVDAWLEEEIDEIRSDLGRHKVE